MRSASTWIAVVVAGAFLVIALVFAANLWGASDNAMSTSGWIAMALGIVFTLAVGIGLMALVFYSSRHGYDEAGGDRR